jgi:hypothetical protein
MLQRPVLEGHMPDRAERSHKTPLSAYRFLSLVFNTALIGLSTSRPAQRRFEKPLSPADFAMMAATTHKLALIVTGERVTKPLRAPFTEQPEDADPKGTPRGTGLRRAIGELLTCPYCVAPWITTGLLAGHVYAPESTRVVTTIFSVVAASDWLSQAHTSLRVDREQDKAKKRLFEKEAETLERGGHVRPRTTDFMLPSDARIAMR